MNKENVKPFAEFTAAELDELLSSCAKSRTRQGDPSDSEASSSDDDSDSDFSGSSFASGSSSSSSLSRTNQRTNGTDAEPELKRMRMDRGETNVCGSRDVRENEQTHLLTICAKIGYFIDQLTQERVHLLNKTK